MWLSLIIDKTFYSFIRAENWVNLLWGGATSISDGIFLTGAPLKVLSVRLHSKSHPKSSKCQNLLTGWHLEFLGGYQWKKPPCRFSMDIIKVPRWFRHEILILKHPWKSKTQTLEQISGFFFTWSWSLCFGIKDKESGESEIKDFSPLSCCAFYWALSTLLLNLASLQCQPPEGKKILKSLRWEHNIF